MVFRALPRISLKHCGLTSALAMTLSAGTTLGMVEYRATDIGLLPGTHWTEFQAGIAINNAGQVIATAVTEVVPADLDNLVSAINRFEAVRYTPGAGLTVLNTLGLTDLEIRPMHINNKGEVFGEVRADHLNHATRRLWRYTNSGGMQILAVPAAVNLGYQHYPTATRFNDSGVVLLTYDEPAGSNFFDSGIHDPMTGWHAMGEFDARLDNPGLPMPWFAAECLNNAGQICGPIRTDSGPMVHRFTPPASIQVLPAVPGAVAFAARSMNQNGDIAGVGVFLPDFSERAVLWRGTQTRIDIHSNMTYTRSDPTVMEGDYVAGGFLDPDPAPIAAWFWDPVNGMQVIDPGPDALSISVDGINARGEVVGNFRSSTDVSEPWIWSPSEGFRILRELIDPFEQEYELHSVQGINDWGEVAVNGSIVSEFRGGVIVIGPRFKADVNRDGDVLVDDIFAFLNLWFSQFGVCTGWCSADFDRDNTVAVADIFAFLGQWFAEF